MFVALPKDRQVYKNTPYTVVLSLLLKCEKERFGSWSFLLSRNMNSPSVAHHSHTPHVSMRDMTERERNSQGHVQAALYLL